MFARRSLTLQLLFGILLGAAVLLRLGVPQGWMPVNDELGFRLVPCDGYGPAETPSMAASMAMDHVAMDHAAMGHGGMDHGAMAPTAGHDGHGGGPDGKHHSPEQPPCHFAGLSVPLLYGDAPALPVAPMAMADTVSPAPLHILPGRGLAAPPPPSTGPPVLL